MESVEAHWGVLMVSDSPIRTLSASVAAVNGDGILEVSFNSSYLFPKET